MRFLEEILDHRLHHRQDVFLVQEGHLDIELREFRLTVGTKVLVAEAADNLEIFLIAGNHKQLLEDLRRLRQSVEFARVQTARNEEVASAFRRALAEHRRFDFEEAVAVKEIAHNLRHAVTQNDVLLHFRAAQVEIAVLQAHHFIYVNAVLDVERRRLRLVEDAQLRADDFHLARLDVRVHRFFAARAYRTANSDTEFVTQGFCLVERAAFHAGFIKDNLHKTGTVTHIHEYESTMVTTAGNPAAQHDIRAYIFLAKLATMMVALHAL